MPTRVDAAKIATSSRSARTSAKPSVSSEKTERRAAVAAASVVGSSLPRAAGMRRRCSRGNVVISTTRIGVSFNSFVTEQRGRRKVL